MLGYVCLKEDKSIRLKSSGQKNQIKLRTGLIVSDKPIVSFEQYKVLLIGKITGLYCKDFDLSEYMNRQEELVFKLYKKYGDSFLPLLDGHFLILIYSKNDAVLKIYNNRYQATSLYYYLDKELFIFADNLKRLLNNSLLNPEFDPDSIPIFLATGFSFTEKTQFKNVFRLLPTFMIFIKEGKVNFSNYWRNEFKFQRKPFDNLKKHLDRYEKCFQQSIQNYLDYAKPKELGCFLSGGHDTTFAYIQASKVFKKSIHTFTASFEGYGFDEAPKAKAITEMFGGVHHRVLIGPQHLDLIPSMVRAAEEPVSGSSLPMYVCAKEAAKYVGAVLTGDAGDTLWNEYYPVAEWHKYFKCLPFFVRKHLHKLSKIAVTLNDWERLWELEHVFSLFAKKNMYEDFFSRLCTYRHFNEEFLKKLLTQELQRKIKKNRCMLNIPFTPSNFSDALIEAKMFYGVYMYMIPPTQKPLENMGVKFYTPYFNHELIEFITSLPEGWVNGGFTFRKLCNKAVNRRFHKMALLRYLPAKQVYSLQQSFDVPFHALFSKRPEILKKLLIRLKRRGWYNNKALDNLFDEFPKQKIKLNELCELKHHGYRIYSLLIFEVWCMEFLDNFVYAKKEKVIPLEDYLSL